MIQMNKTASNVHFNTAETDRELIFQQLYWYFFVTDPNRRDTWGGGYLKVDWNFVVGTTKFVLVYLTLQQRNFLLEGTSHFLPPSQNSTPNQVQVCITVSEKFCRNYDKTFSCNPRISSNNRSAVPRSD
ncbi:hypothetical protein [Leptospira borgpetersenii]|nr:hypothetical protein [Leptospira borgpetersenii]EKQ99169.1 hypothetical protein LEP1GSC121_2729 [Leptospira borgpetersenii serovar Castellonis str. 200801910]EMN12875.1 hypothetical protein LEP1GSC055_3415 [Leptospira borgpetersenii str. Brem 307]EMN15532.1 hypothetical protein LEP1GSC056_3651 [Leptospira borgpetersenii str. Brem 328]KGE23241.1 hypothetical protein IQ66_12945 [Leptospira borgpetersenii serovar Ballum]MBE8201211.1 hypothetical protein [Leptospira borgpetersenii serovar Ballu